MQDIFMRFKAVYNSCPSDLHPSSTWMHEIPFLHVEMNRISIDFLSTVYISGESFPHPNAAMNVFVLNAFIWYVFISECIIFEYDNSLMRTKRAVSIIHRSRYFQWSEEKKFQMAFVRKMCFLLNFLCHWPTLIRVLCARANNKSFRIQFTHNFAHSFIFNGIYFLVRGYSNLFGCQWIYVNRTFSPQRIRQEPLYP